MSALTTVQALAAVVILVAIALHLQPNKYSTDGEIPVFSVWKAVPTVSGPEHCSESLRPRNLRQTRLPNHSRVHACQLDPATLRPVVSLDDFPLVGKAKACVFEPDPGDIIYLPSEYWHWVVSGPEETMAVNTWIGSEAQREHRNFSEPALLKKLGAGWKAMQKWTPEWVERHGESFNIEHSVFACVRDGNSIHPEDVADHEALPAHVSVFETLPAFFEAYRDTSGRYTACFASVKVFPEADMLRNKDAHLPLPASDQEANVHLWLSRGLLETGLHYDDFSNSNLLLRGRKRFLVMPPHDSPHLYQNAELDPAWDLGSPQGRAARQAFLKDLERAEADFEGQFQDDQADMFMEPPGVLGRNDNMNMANGEFPPDDEDPEDADQGEQESPQPLQRRKRVRLEN